jgi:DNA-binding transcriptional regulator YiaG
MKKNHAGKRRSRGTLALLESLAELQSAVRDGLTVRDIPARFPTRTRVLAPSPGEYTPQKIKILRERMNVSQGDFADLVGVSRVLVQSWEQGVRQPSPLARRMLDTINNDPAAWLASLHRQAKASARPRSSHRRAG